MGGSKGPAAERPPLQLPAWPIVTPIVTDGACPVVTAIVTHGAERGFSLLITLTCTAMPLPTIAGTVRCAVSGLMPSLQPWTNVWHCRYAGGASTPGDSDISALDALFARFYSGTGFGTGVPWLSRCHAGVTCTKISYVRLNATALGVDVVKAFAGAAGGNSLPSQSSPVLTLRTATRGRSYRGRIYLPAPTTTAADAQGRMLTTVTTPTLAQLTGLQAALGGPAATPFWEIGVASYLLAVFSPLLNPTMDLDIDVQRRRKN